MTYTLQMVSCDDFAQVAQLEVQLQPQDGWTTDDLWALYHTREATGFGVLGIYLGKQLVSYLVYQMLDVAEVLRIGTMPRHQEQGLAKWLLSHWLEGLPADMTCLLEVRADNIAAIALYQRLGFEQLHKRRGYYRDGCDGLIFSKAVHPSLDKPAHQPDTQK